MKYFLFYLLLINLISFILAVTDKGYAIKRTHRISEQTLLLFAIAGGGIGLLLGLLLCNHKTRKVKFMVGVPIIILIEVIVLAVIIS